MSGGGGGGGGAMVVLGGGLERRCFHWGLSRLQTYLSEPSVQVPPEKYWLIANWP